MNFKIQQAYPQPSEGITTYNTLTYVPAINSLVLYGQQKHSTNKINQQPKKKISFKSNKNDSAPTIDKVAVFSLQTWQWKYKQCKGKIPSTRNNFESVCLGQCLIIYGGKVGEKYSNQIYALNTESWMWKKLFTLEGPPNKLKKLICKMNEKKLLLLVQQSLWILDTQDVKWQLASNELPGSVWQKLPIDLNQNVSYLLRVSDEKCLIIGEQRSYIFDLNDKKVISSEKHEIQNNFTFQQPLILSEFVQNHALIVLSQKVFVLSIQHNTIVFSTFPELNIPPHIHCATIIKANHLYSVYLMDKKGQIYCIKIQSQLQDRLLGQAPETTRILQSPNNNKQNPVITEEDDQGESSMLNQNESSRVNQFSNNSGSEVKKRYHNEPKMEEQPLKIRRLTHSESQVMIDDQSKQSEVEPNPDQLKNKLQIILTHQYLKRRLLEQKNSKLENIIKKSQKFVLMLCKYGNQHQKKKHIEKVKSIRQQLEYNLSKENYYRKQMQNNEINIGKISKNVDEMLEKIIN